MGLTIEDMMMRSKDKYKVELIAGQNGWANSISWILLVEDHNILNNFKGKDLAITTGLGFTSESDLLDLVKSLVRIHASGLIINTGKYIFEIPQSVIDYSNENDFPLMIVPWEITLYDMIKDMSMRIFLSSAVDEQISKILIHAIESPDTLGMEEKDLLPYFDLDGIFQVILISTGDLDIMDTVDRRRLSYQLQIYLEGISHNAHFFYYDSCFVLVVNALQESETKEIIRNFVARANRRMPDRIVYVGIGSIIHDFQNLQISYQRAKSALNMAHGTDTSIITFDEMGMYRLLSMVSDDMLLREMGTDLLRPLIEYDKKHDNQYLDTLWCFLRQNGSIQAVSDEMFTHRNTIIYRLNNIKKLLNSNLDTAEERNKYYIACMIHRMKSAKKII